MVWKTTADPDREAIIITIPQKSIAEIPGGRAALCRTLENLHLTEENIWPYSISHLPDSDPIVAYVAFGGKIRYRMSIAGTEKNVTRKFDYGGSFRIFENRNWILLSGPAVKAPQTIPFVGYYGFQYSKILF